MTTVIEGTAIGLITKFITHLIKPSMKKLSTIEKKKRLGELLTLIHSVIESAEGTVIHSSSLKRWLEKLKEAAHRGDRALEMGSQLLVSEEKSKADIWVVSRIVSIAASAKKFLFTDGGEIKELDFALQELEAACNNLHYFLQLIELDRSSKKVMATNKVVVGDTSRVFYVCDVVGSISSTQFEDEKVNLSQFRIVDSKTDNPIQLATNICGKRKLESSSEYVPSYPPLPIQVDVGLNGTIGSANGDNFNNFIREKSAIFSEAEIGLGDGGMNKKMKLLEETVCFLVSSDTHSTLEEGSTGGYSVLTVNPQVGDGECSKSVHENPFVDRNLED